MYILNKFSVCNSKHQIYVALYSFLQNSVVLNRFPRYQNIDTSLQSRCRYHTENADSILHRIRVVSQSSHIDYLHSISIAIHRYSDFPVISRTTDLVHSMHAIPKPTSCIPYCILSYPIDSVRYLGSLHFTFKI